jgi:hypothetical protein
VNPEDVVAVDQDFKCSVCGAELTMRAMNVQDDAPPHRIHVFPTVAWRPDID